MFYSKLTTTFPIFIIFLLVASLGLNSCLNARKITSQLSSTSLQISSRILVFSKTKGWKHTSIPYGIGAVQKMGKENNFQVDTTTNAAYFTEDSLRNYQAVIFNCTTGKYLE